MTHIETFDFMVFEGRDELSSVFQTDSKPVFHCWLYFSQCGDCNFDGFIGDYHGDQFLMITEQK